MTMTMALARAPALVIEGLLNYTRSEHTKIYQSGIRQVSGEDPLDCKPEGLHQFLKDVRDRSNQMGLSDLGYSLSPSTEATTMKGKKSHLTNWCKKHRIIPTS